MKTKEKIKKAVGVILRDIRKNGISHKHRKAEINPDCPECKFRMLEGFLLWYEDLLDFNE